MFCLNKELDLIDSIENKGLSNDDFLTLKRLSRSCFSEVRIRVAEILAQEELSNGAEILLKLCNDKNYLVRASACDSISIYNDLNCFKQLLLNLHDENSIVVNYAIGSACVLVLNYMPEKICDLKHELDKISYKDSEYVSSLHCAKYVLGDGSMVEFIKHDLQDDDSYVKSRTLQNLNLFKSYCNLHVFFDVLNNLCNDESEAIYVKDSANALMNYISKKS